MTSEGATVNENCAIRGVLRTSKLTITAVYKVLNRKS